MLDYIPFKRVHKRRTTIKYKKYLITWQAVIECCDDLSVFSFLLVSPFLTLIRTLGFPFFLYLSSFPSFSFFFLFLPSLSLSFSFSLFFYSSPFLFFSYCPFPPFSSHLLSFSFLLLFLIFLFSPFFGDLSTSHDPFILHCTHLARERRTTARRLYQSKLIVICRFT